jgi:hypothetical protein
MNTYVDILLASLRASESRSSKLDQSVFSAVGGFSGEKFKHLLNNLGSHCQCYLEIGSLHGASLTAACYQNATLKAFAIENFSEFDAKEAVLRKNASRFAPQATLILADAWSPDTISRIPDNSIDLYFYDGNHSEESQAKALLNYSQKMCDRFIYIVDDWNWEQVKSGAVKGVERSGFVVEHLREIHTKDGDASGYWNGLGLYVMSRP